MDDPLDLLEAQIQSVQKLIGACKTQDQRNQLAPSLQQAQLNFQNALNKAFEANDDNIAILVTQMRKAQDSLKKMTQQLANFSKVIEAVSTAVRIGTELAAMAK